MINKKPIGKYLGNGKVELNDEGIGLIASQIKPNEIITEEELLKRVNKKLKNQK